MVQGQYTLCVLFIDFFFFKQTTFLCLGVIFKNRPAYNSNIVDSVTAGVFLKYKLLVLSGSHAALE